MRYTDRSGGCGWRWRGCNYRWPGHWPSTWRSDWRRCWGRDWCTNRSRDPGRSRPRLWSAASRRLSICAIRRRSRVISQPLYWTRLRSARCSARRIDSRCRYGTTLPATLISRPPIYETRSSRREVNAFSFATRPPACARRHSSSEAPATVDDNFRQLIFASRRNPCASRCFARSARDRVSRLGF